MIYFNNLKFFSREISTMKSDEESDVSYESGIDASDSKEGLNVNNVMLDETVSF